MASIYTGFSDTDANAALNWYFQGGLLSTIYLGLLTALPTDSVGDGLAEPWLVAPAITGITSVSTGGSIAPDTRYYEVTAVNASGETTASAEVSYTVPSGTSTNVVTVSWGTVSGAVTYNLYEASTSGDEGLIASGISTTYYQDTGPDTPGASPPSSNTTGYGYGRLAVAANSTNFPDASGRSITNGVTLTFATPTGTWGTCTGIGIFDGPNVDANFRASGYLLNPLVVGIGAPPYLGVGAFAIPFF